MDNADVIVVGHGLAGLVATYEITRAGRSVVLIDKQGANDSGGQAFWSFGGLFMVDTPEQRLFGIRDSRELAIQDWLSSAQFTDGPNDEWARRWAMNYVDFASGEKRAWLRSLGWRAFPIPGWPERGGAGAREHGNSVPRFHTTWGTGPGIVSIFENKVRQAEARGKVKRLYRHRLEELTVTDGRVTGVSGTVLKASSLPRGVKTDDTIIGDFALSAEAVLLATGGVGGNPELVRELFVKSYGNFPEGMLCGNPAYVDGKALQIATNAGANVVNTDRLWFYPDGVTDIDPVWPNHGIHLMVGPSPLWLDGDGHRLPPTLYPNFDTVGALKHIVNSGHPYSWLIMNRRMFAREFGLSGQEQNPPLTGRHPWPIIKQAIRPTISSHFQDFLDRGVDFATGSTIGGLAHAMNAIPDVSPIDRAQLEREIVARDAQLANRVSKDPQLAEIREARRFWPHRTSITTPRPLQDPKDGPLIAIKMHICTRKTLGGIQTDTGARALTPQGQTLPGLYAAGETSGFGGGGIHGHRSLEGTFVGGCLFTGRTAGQNIAGDLS